MKTKEHLNLLLTAVIFGIVPVIAFNIGFAYQHHTISVWRAGGEIVAAVSILIPVVYFKNKKLR